MGGCFRKKQGLYLLLFIYLPRILGVAIHYSLPEEKKIGSLVANVLKDLKGGIGELSARRAQLVSETTKQYFHLDALSGNLLVNEQIDREELCGQTDSCLLLSQIVLENPLELYKIEITIDDVNDNAPKFSQNHYELKIPENVLTNSHFPLEPAQDEDLGKNNIQNYTLSPNEHFQLDMRSTEDGNKHVDLVLKKSLDREKKSHFGLILMAVDGGMPQKTGTVQINIIVLDINDNSPNFIHSEYKTKLKENSPRGTLVSRVEAEDLDSGPNAQITYSFHRMPEKIHNLFQLNETTGELSVFGRLDYEKETSYDLNIRATDGGGLSGHCRVLVVIEDVNDNAPEVSLISFTSTIPEDSPLDTVVALFRVTDRDSGDNGRTVCSVDGNLPFALKVNVNSYYQLVIQSPLDREKNSEYNMTIIVIDHGSPRLTSSRIINIEISDVNDNSPVFESSSYEMYVKENNIPGLLLGSVHAIDQDTALNAKVSYSLLPGKVGESPVASYVSINSETGNLYALRSLDYEQIKDFTVLVKATDGGSPALSSQVVVQVVIVDENDNAPFFLYPLQNSTSPYNELVPKLAEAGYLVTKVVAVDGDSGQNSWLSYELLKATDPGLFSIGAQNGEVRTKRVLSERDTSKQRLLILVRDNGFPPQTSTAMLHILPVDGFSEPYMKTVDISQEEFEEDRSLTMYLVICLAVVSSMFLICIILFVVIKLYKRMPTESCISVPPQFPPVIPENCADSQNGSLSRTYHYDICLTGGSLSSEFRFLRPLIPVFSVNHQISSGPQDVSDEVAGNESRGEARASLSEDAAPRAGAPGCPVNQATGANVNTNQNDWLAYQ
uniref:Protocadherin beta-1 n=1 Tax=Salvator merianae TaxID=96440 RepID=A0A8D0E0U0_SALMN